MGEQISFEPGITIDKAVETLLKYKEQGKSVCGNFNGFMLYSDTVTLDSAYLEITGKSKEDLVNSVKEWGKKLDEQQREHIKKIPSLAEKWMREGREILSEDKWSYWDELVPIRLNDMYQGIELGHCLDLVKILKEENSFEKAKEELRKQEHSGLSYSLVCAMVKAFSDKGVDFVAYLEKGDNNE